MEKNERGSFTVQNKKKKSEIFEEVVHRVDFPPDISDQK